jgi:hypothetical protein
MLISGTYKQLSEASWWQRRRYRRHRDRRDYMNKNWSKRLFYEALKQTYAYHFIRGLPFDVD